MIERLKSFEKKFEREQGITIEIPCPKCQEKLSITELVWFGNIYEFTCPSCSVTFMVEIPEIAVKAGKIEALYDSSNKQV